MQGGVLGADADCLIEDGRTTIASLLGERGYATAIFGKWHLGLQIAGTRGDRDWSEPVTDGPLQKGFDTFYGLPASMNFGALTWFDGDRATAPATMWTRKKFPPAEITTAPLDYRMAPPYDAERQTNQDVEVAPGFEDVDALRIITDHTVEYIEEHVADPFFVYVAFTSPHLPHCTAPEFRGASGMGNYGDFLAETDHRIGQILEALDRCGLAENTLVVFTSDNGPENNYKDWSRLYGHESAGGFRGGKRDVYEGGHRVPFIVRWPGVIVPGRVSDEPVGQVDLLATIADVVGMELEPGQAEDSLSLLPVLVGGRLQRPRHTPIIHHGRGQFAIRDGRWKLIFGKNRDEPRFPGPPAELFNLLTDPGETANVLDDHPDIVEQLQPLARESVMRNSSH
jgi:arylsulfatase A